VQFRWFPVGTVAAVTALAATLGVVTTAQAGPRAQAPVPAPPGAEAGAEPGAEPGAHVPDPGAAPGGVREHSESEYVGPDVRVKAPGPQVLDMPPGVFAVAAAPVTPNFGRAIDGYAKYAGQTSCNLAAKPGVVGFQKMILKTYPGTRNLGIARACRAGGRSEHKEARAWDWGVNVRNRSEAAKATAMLNWLLATDRHGNRHALARRFGIMYIIWNRKMWRAYAPSKGWQRYTGPNPHVDHVHISFGWPGARKQTSWWRAG
jgi:hypothetical protein